MKKFIIATSALLLSNTAHASWTQEQKDDFYQMLYKPEQVVDVNSKINMVRFIECMTKYYESYHPYETIERWKTALMHPSDVTEFRTVQSECRTLVLHDAKSTNA